MDPDVDWARLYHFHVWFLMDPMTIAADICELVIPCGP